MKKKFDLLLKLKMMMLLMIGKWKIGMIRRLFFWVRKKRRSVWLRKRWRKRLLSRNVMRWRRKWLRLWLNLWWRR